MLVVVDLHGLRVNIRFQRVYAYGSFGRVTADWRRQPRRPRPRCQFHSALRVSMGYLLSESITGGARFSFQRPLRAYVLRDQPRRAALG